jgi:hypothetical protein
LLSSSAFADVAHKAGTAVPPIGSHRRHRRNAAAQRRFDTNAGAARCQPRRRVLQIQRRSLCDVHEPSRGAIDLSEAVARKLVNDEHQPHLQSSIGAC